MDRFVNRISVCSLYNNANATASFFNTNPLCAESKTSSSFTMGEKNIFACNDKEVTAVANPIATDNQESENVFLNTLQ